LKNRLPEAKTSSGGGRPWRRIATEEAFAIPEQARALADIGRTAWDSLDVDLLRILHTTQATPVFVDIYRRLLDRFPGLTIVLGHMGALHLWCIDFMSTSYRQRVGLRLTPTEYFKRNRV
jgi:predicted TIM-barrel fold metal-dependent hydrolase